jgi:hypothetical protein
VTSSTPAGSIHHTGVVSEGPNGVNPLAEHGDYLRFHTRPPGAMVCAQFVEPPHPTPSELGAGLTPATAFSADRRMAAPEPREPAGDQERVRVF